MFRLRKCECESKKFSLMFVAYSLILFAFSDLFAFAWCKKALRGCTVPGLTKAARMNTVAMVDGDEVQAVLRSLGGGWCRPTGRMMIWRRRLFPGSGRMMMMKNCSVPAKQRKTTVISVLFRDLFTHDVCVCPSVGVRARLH